MFVKQVTIGKQVSLTFLALLEVSVGAVREISRIALWQCQCLFTMQWIYVMYSTKKIYVMLSLNLHEQWTKKYYGNSFVPWYGAFVCVLLHFVAFPLRLCLPTCVCNWGHPRHHGAELILYLKERMPCIGLCVDHGTEPGLVHFCDFLAFPLQLCLRTFVCNWGHPVVKASVCKR